MSLDIYLYPRDEMNEADVAAVAEMNWLRNPFGLEPWIRHNTGHDLHAVINDHAYDRSDLVDRAEFLRQVQAAVAAVDALDAGTFLVDLDVQYSVHTIRDLMRQGLVAPLRIVGSRGQKPSNWSPRSVCVTALIDQDQLARATRHSHLWGDMSLDHYKAWAHELLAFAHRLQDPDLVYYCSN